MAAKKPTQKPAPAKKAVKKTAPSSKKSAAAAKAPGASTQKSTSAGKSAAGKKAAPEKKPAAAKPASEKKPATPAQKALPKKAAPVKAAAAPVSKAPAVKAGQKEKAAPQESAAKKETPAAKPVKTVAAKPAPPKKSSLIDYPVPPAPVKPPFVPPKANALQETTAGSNGVAGGSHSASFIQKQKQRLLDLRDELVDAMSGMTRDTIRNAPEGSEASGSGQHQGDAGSDAYDRDFALSVLAKEQDALYEIEQALRRIKVGTYGVCEMSSKKIPQARLEAIPFARLTVECQAQWEKEYGKTRFRPSNEVGFSGGAYADDEDSDTVSLDEEED